MAEKKTRQIIACLLSMVLLLSACTVFGEAGVSPEKRALGLMEDILSFQLRQTGAGSLQD